MKAIALILLCGISFSFVGYGPLSLKRNPTAGTSFAVFGFIFRLLGPPLILLSLFPFALAGWRGQGILGVILTGIVFSFLGYGPLSLRKHPERGAAFAVVGFLFRFVGPLLIGVVVFWLLATAVLGSP